MRKILDAIMFVNKKILVMLLIVFTLIVMLQVVARYVFHSPLTWSEQVARYLFIWMIMLGTPLAMRMNVHIAFDMILKWLPRHIQRGVEIFNLFLIAVFACYWFLKSLDLVLRSVETIAAGIEIPMNYIYSAQPVGAALLLVVSIEALFKREGTVKKESEVDPS